MAVYEYKGVAISSGKAVKGVRDAENPKALRAALRREGVLLSSATEESQRHARGQSREIDVFAFFKRSGTNDVAVMTRQLATLVRAGIPLVESISALTEQIEKQDLKRIMTAVRERLNEGTSFAKTLEVHPQRIFPPLYVNMVAAGEASGTLEAVLERLADFMEAQARLKGKVGAALAYPVLMTIIGIGLMSVMMIAVVPKVTSIFQSLDHPLPWYTQALIAVSNFLSGYWWLVIMMMGGGYWLFQRWVKKPEGRLRWDTIQLGLPIFGKLLQMLAISRFAKTLSTLLASGVPLLKAMEIVRNVLGNAALENVVAEAAGSIREGETIADPLRRSGRFPPIVTHMIAVGEKSGQLEQMLSSVSDSYDAQVEVRVQALTSLLEPLIIVVMGGAVGFIAFAILMPLIQMNEFVQ
jgi:general secretion pathway protein F